MANVKRGSLSGASTGGIKFGKSAAESAGIPWEMIKPFVRPAAAINSDTRARKFIRGILKSIPDEERRVNVGIAIKEWRREGLTSEEIVKIFEEARAEMEKRKALGKFAI